MLDDIVKNSDAIAVTQTSPEAHRNELIGALRRPNYRAVEIAALLDLSCASVYRMLKRGELPSSKRKSVV